MMILGIARSAKRMAIKHPESEDKIIIQRI